MSRPPYLQADSAAGKSSSVYHSVPTLASHSHQVVDESFLPSRKKKLIARVALVTIALILCLAWYVFIAKHTTLDWEKLVVTSTAGPTQFLLISTLSAVISKVFAAPLMALHAYAAAADWLRSSRSGLQHRQPSPTHLASLLSLFYSASFSSLAVVGLGGMTRRHLAWPRILKRAVALLMWILLLIYSLIAINVWLNIDAQAVMDATAPVDYSSPVYRPEATRFSRQVDQPSCSKLDSKAHTYCGAVEGGEDPDIEPDQITINAVVNGSVDTGVAWLDNNIAILVTATPPTFGYSAQALGVRAVCMSVTDQCARCNVTQPEPHTVISCEEQRAQVSGGGELSMTRLSCPQSLDINITMVQYDGPKVSYLPVGPIGQERTDSESTYLEFGNPFRYGDVVLSLTYYNESLSRSAAKAGLSYFIGDTGFLRSYRNPAVNVMSCEISVYDVEYEFIPPAIYVSTSWTLTNATTASYVAYRMAREWFHSAGRGFESIDGSGRSGRATYSEIYGRQLSKIAIATTSRILPPSPALQLYGVRTPGTQVTLVGMLLLVLVLVLLIVTTVIIGIHAAIVILRSESKFLAAARGRLISVYPLIGDSFGGLKADFDTHLTAVSSGMSEKAFEQETEADRLQLVQEPVDGGPADGKTARLRPRRVGMFNDGSA